MRIYKEFDNVIFECDGEKYTLTSHPYEPCLYINEDGKTIKTIHNAFEAQNLPERLSDGGSVLGADGRYYDEEDFCNALEAALEYENNECNFTFAAMLSKEEKKSPSDFITDGVLAYGVSVGHFLFEEENITVYAVSDLPHISASDAFTLYQISPADYKKLLRFSLPDRIPEPPMPAKEIEPYRKRFLCGESVYQARYYFRLRNADKALIVKNETMRSVMNFCPNCGRKGNGDKFCRDCGTNLIIEKRCKMKITKIIETSCKCKFYLDNGDIIETRIEYKGGKPGLDEGVYAYKDSMRYLNKSKKLNADEIKELIEEYQRFFEINDDSFEIDYFEDKEPKLIEKGDYRGVRGLIYEHGDGTVVAVTLCSECKIADSIEEFKAIPREKLELMIYSNEMDVAR